MARRVPRVTAPLVAILCGAYAEMPKSAYAPEAVQHYDPDLTRAFAALSTVAYCAQQKPGGVPRGLVKAVESNCGDSEGSWCRAAGFSVVPGKVKYVNLPDLGKPCQIFAIVAKWRRRVGLSASSKIPEEEGCVVAIRGSIGNPASDPNWERNSEKDLTNATDWPDCYKCKVHSGYHQIWLAMKESLVSKLEGVGCTAGDASPVYVTGHSLGGALTYLSMYGLKTLGFDVQTSYNFESPRTGNSYFITAFAKLMGKEVPLYHVTHSTDKVPRGPPRDTGFRHTPFQVFYHEEDKNFTVCSDPTDAKCGILQYDRSSLTDVKTTLPDVSPHCVFPEAPYGNFCQFQSLQTGKGLFLRTDFFLGQAGKAAFGKVCQQGGLMSYPGEPGGTSYHSRRLAGAVLV